jgi:ribonuclease J
MIQIQAIGGYNEVGKNCTAITIDNTTILCDLGLHLEPYINFTESEGNEDLKKVSSKALMQVGAIPDISKIDKNQVKLIIPTHAHLDHVGAIPYLSNKFNADILATPFTVAVLNTILKDENISLKNEIKTLNVNSTYQLNKEIKIEFINMTHSTPQTVMVAIHTKYGIIIYANDFKLDNNPIVGKPANIKRLKELKNKVIALICDSTYSNESKKTPSESVAKEMLKDVLLGTDSKDKLIVVTTFASHLARLKSIIDLGQKLNRKILFLGRSLAKYTQAGEEINIIRFKDKIEVSKYSKQVRKRLKRIKNNERKNYLLVITGHQGEPKAVLSKIANNKLDFKLKPEDHVIFSCTVIPTETNINNRKELESSLRNIGVRIFKDIHVSGHAAREDLRDLINILKPKTIIPAHGNIRMRKGMLDLAIEMNYNKNSVILLNNGQKKNL